MSTTSVEQVNAATLKFAWPQYLGLAVLGIFVGLFSGVLGVGGGIVMIPAFVLGFGFTQPTAQGLSLAVMAPLAVVNAVTYFKEGAFSKAHLPLILVVLVCAMVTGPIGSTIANRIDPNKLKMLFASFIIIFAVRMMPKADFKSMGALLGLLLVAIGVRMVFAK